MGKQQGTPFTPAATRQQKLDRSHNALAPSPRLKALAFVTVISLAIWAVLFYVLFL